MLLISDRNGDLSIFTPSSSIHQPNLFDIDLLLHLAAITCIDADFSVHRKMLLAIAAVAWEHWLPVCTVYFAGLPASCIAPQIRARVPPDDMTGRSAITKSTETRY